MNVKCPNCGIEEIIFRKLDSLKRCNVCNGIFCTVCFEEHLDVIHNDCNTLLTKDYELKEFEIKADERKWK